MRSRRIFVAALQPAKDLAVEPLVRAIEQCILQAGLQAFIGFREIEKAGLHDPACFVPFIRDEIQTCRLVIVAHHPALRGGLVEAGIAYAFGIPAWLVFRRGDTPSSTLTGCCEKLVPYTDLDGLNATLQSCLHPLAFP